MAFVYNKNSIVYHTCNCQRYFPTNNSVKFIFNITGGDVNNQTQEGYTPLFIACFCNHLEIVRILLAAKASVNLPASGITT